MVRHPGWTRAHNTCGGSTRAADSRRTKTAVQRSAASGSKLSSYGSIWQQSSKSPLAKLNEWLDTPFLDTGKRGGPLEPFKRFARLEPELASAAASTAALSFFALLGWVAVQVAMSVSG